MTFAIQDGSTNPLNDVEVHVTTDLAGTLIYAGTLETDAQGEVTFQMDTGTFFVFRQKSGFNFTTNPQTVVVSGIQTFTFTDGVVAGAATSARLSAVNEIMGLNGIPSVTTLDTGQPTEVGEAERILDLINKKVQLRGWNTNKEIQVDFTPGVGGVVTFASDIIKVSYPTYRGDHRTLGDPLDAWSVRGGKLFNQVDQTNDFSDLSVVTFDIIRLLTFDTLPLQVES